MHNSLSMLLVHRVVINSDLRVCFDRSTIMTLKSTVFRSVTYQKDSLVSPGSIRRTHHFSKLPLSNFSLLSS
jgi:hypothetical protein